LCGILPLSETPTKKSWIEWYITLKRSCRNFAEVASPMIRPWILAFIFLWSIPVSPMQAAAAVDTVAVKVADGTPIEIELKTNISSEDIKPGTAVDFAIVQPVRIGEVTVVERGAPVKVRIKEAQKALHWGRQGTLILTIEGALAVDGSQIGLRFAEPEIREEGGNAGRIAKAVVLAPLYAYCFPLTAVGLGLASRKGQPVVTRAGERYEVYVDGEVVVKAGPSVPPVGQPREEKGQPSVTTENGEMLAASLGGASTSEGEELDPELNLGQRYLLLKNAGSDVQRQLTSAAAAGFRVTRWQHDGIILEKVASPPDTFRYLHLESTTAVRLQNQLNELGASGYQLFRGSASSWQVQNIPLGYTQKFSVLLEKEPHPHNCRYRLVDLPPNMDSRWLRKQVLALREVTAQAMAEAYQQGYREVEQIRFVGGRYGGGFAILEKPIATLLGGPARDEFKTERFLSLHASKPSALQREVSEGAARGYRMTASGFLEKVAKPPDTYEYLPIPDKKGPELEPKLKEAGAQGFHLSPNSGWLEKVPHSAGQYQYLVLEGTQLSSLNDAMAKPVAQGYQPVTVRVYSGLTKATRSLILEREKRDGRAEMSAGVNQ
jgi:hypothetical protein